MHYEAIFKAFQKRKVDYLIAGGMAVNLHGIPRFTRDLDILVSPSQENLSCLKRALEALGYRPRVPVSPEAFLDPANWPRWKREKGMHAFSLWSSKHPLEEIDILTDSPVPFEKAKRRRDAVHAGGLRLNLVSIDDLIRMKKEANRKQDLADIESLTILKRMRKGRAQKG